MLLPLDDVPEIFPLHVSVDPLDSVGSFGDSDQDLVHLVVELERCCSFLGILKFLAKHF